MRTQFINPREVLLTQTASGESFYFTETSPLGKTYTTAAEAWADHRDDDATKFIVFDLDALHGIDVTEAMALAFLDEVNDLTPHDEDRLPTFVRTSEAWELFCEEWTTRNGLFSQRSHGTLNHAMQGIRA